MQFMLMVYKNERFTQAPDAAEAVELAKTFPGVEAGFAVEVRPVMTSEEDQQCWRQT